MDRVIRAYRFAEAAHKRQLRKYTNEPYIMHCIAVSQLVVEHGLGADVQAAALLHDTIEDTPASYDYILELFGPAIATLVQEVTDVSKPSDGNRAIRKALDLQHLAKASADGQSIKLADLIDNTKSIVEHDPNFAKVYLKEKAALLQVLTKGASSLINLAYDSLESGWRALLEPGSNVFLRHAPPLPSGNN